MMADLLPIGSQAPDFCLPAAGGEMISLGDLVGQTHVVLIFYVGDNTPDCNRQLASLRDDTSDFAEMGIRVVGINPASVEDHSRYGQQLGLNFPLLSDAAGAVAARYGALGLDRSVQRSVYIIDKEGVVRFAARGLHWTPEFYDALTHLP